MPPGILVRPVKPSDVTGLSRLYGGLAPESRRAPFLSLIDGPSSAELPLFCGPDRLTREGFVAVASGPSADRPEIVGHLCLEPGGPMTIEAVVAVADAWRAQGIGTALAVQGLLWARGHDVHFLRLSTYVRNPAAFRLLGRLAAVSPVAHRGGGRRAARRRPSDWLAIALVWEGLEAVAVGHRSERANETLWENFEAMADAQAATG